MISGVIPHSEQRPWLLDYRLLVRVTGGFRCDGLDLASGWPYGPVSGLLGPYYALLDVHTGRLDGIC